MPPRRRPGPLSGAPSAGEALLNVLGEYVLSRHDEVGQETLIRALGVLGFSGDAVRQAVSRAAREGALVTSRQGNRSYVRLADGAARTLSRGVEHVERSLTAAQAPRTWDGEWDVFVVRTRRQDQAGRYQLRTTMMLEGLGYLGNGIWLSPKSPMREELTRVLSADESVSPVVMTSRIAHPDVAELIGGAWDLEALTQRYRRLLDRYSAEDPQSGSEQFAAWTGLVHAWKQCVLADPGLPDEVLPAGWPRGVAAGLVVRRREDWRPTARAYFDSLAE